MTTFKLRVFLYGTFTSTLSGHFSFTADAGRDSEGSSGSEIEEYSGMEQPPLIKQLKTILAEYPDDGQIIKVDCQTIKSSKFFFSLHLKYRR